MTVDKLGFNDMTMTTRLNGPQDTLAPSQLPSACACNPMCRYPDGNYPQFITYLHLPPPCHRLCKSARLFSTGPTLAQSPPNSSRRRSADVKPFREELKPFLEVHRKITLDAEDLRNDSASTNSRLK